LQSSTELGAPILFFLTSRREPRRRHTGSPRCMRNRCRRNVFTEPLPRNGSDITAHLNNRCIATCYVTLDPL
jgi:hypothetical protein